MQRIRSRRGALRKSSLRRGNDALCRFEVAWTENDATDDIDDFFAERSKVIGTVFDGKEG